MIPVLGIPILTGLDLLNNLLKTITVDVGHLVIIDNGNIVDEIIIGENIKRVSIVTMPNNIGVPAAWNLIIKSTVSENVPWWMINNFDTEYTKSALNNIVEKSGRDQIVTSSKGWAAFTIGSGVIEKIGLFDEGFAPAYCEDLDYEHRARCGGIEIIKCDDAIKHHDHITAADMKWNLKKMIDESTAQYVKKWGGVYREEKLTNAAELGWNIKQWI